MVLSGSGPKGDARSRKRVASNLLAVLLSVAMVLQSSPFAYAEEILAAVEQEEAVAAEVVDESKGEEPAVTAAVEEAAPEEEAAPVT